VKTHLVLHHSLTKDSKTVSWDAIRRYHVEHNGWRAIGYHLGVELVGDHYEMFSGRPLLDRAAAAYQRNMNRLGVHVCFVGDYDKEPPPLDMLQFAAPLLADICEALQIPVDGTHVIGHREVAPYKSCPGTKFNIEAFISLLKGA
jgi:hypothetical protein